MLPVSARGFARESAGTGSRRMSEELLAEVRKAAPSALWSSGVKLARGGGVTLSSRDGDRVTVRVRDPAHPMTRRDEGTSRVVSRQSSDGNPPKSSKVMPACSYPGCPLTDDP